jgi:AcrR family transcriptional regulator
MTTLQGYAKGRAKRSEIIEQAMTLFGESGYRGASLREVAARCGMSHPGLLHHFPTKEALLQAVLERRDAEDSARLAVSRGTGLEPLRRLLDLVALNATRRGIVELFTVVSAEATSVEHPAHGYFVARYARAVATAERAYREASGAGALAPGVDPVGAGPALVALMDGLQLQWLLDGGRTDMAAIVRASLQAQLTVPL